MTLDQYLQRRGIPAADFADTIGVHVWSLRRYLAGERIPAPSVLQRIAIATDRKVLPNDFYPQIFGAA